jgi:hypothetical protein
LCPITDIRLIEGEPSQSEMQKLQEKGYTLLPKLADYSVAFSKDSINGLPIMKTKVSPAQPCLKIEEKNDEFFM